MPVNHLSSQPAWYLLQCKPRQDERAEEHLKNQSFTCYRPLIAVEKRKNGRLVTVKESLFPGYLFVHLRLEDNWAPLKSTRGVSRIVSFGKGSLPYPVADSLIHTLHQRVEQQTSTTVPLFTSGEKVLIQEGCFANLEAIFEQMDGEHRVILLLNLLGRQQSVAVPLSAVRSSNA